MAKAPTRDEQQNANDFAVVIGLSNYRQLSPFSQAARNARAFARWLHSRSGGGCVPEENITLILDEDASTAPMEQVIEDAFHKLFTPSIRRRLYIYMAGYGHRADNDISLCMLGSSSSEAVLLSPLHYANAFRSTGFVDEIVLFVDCALIHASSTRPLTVSLQPSSMLRDALKPTAFFYGIFGDASFLSGTQSSLQEKASFSAAILEGLQGGAAGPDGAITSSTLQQFLLSAMNERGDQQSPLIAFERPITFFDDPSSDSAPNESSEQTRKFHARHERVTTHADNPATVDELGRRPFAEVIAARIDEVRRTMSASDVPTGAFMVHIHGPWGMGKTSVLNFLRAHLQHAKRAPAERWIVVDFNAWRNQRIRPPWWTLIKEVYRQSVQQLRGFHSWLLRARWLGWRAQADWLPAMTATILIGLVIALVTGIIDIVPRPASGATATSKTLAELAELALKIVAAVAAVGTAWITLSRSLIFGSPQAAETYLLLSRDALAPIVTLFEKLISATGRPVAIFIDDLDRCEGKYVVELLEGTQTLFRNAPVAYVIAADRKWICSSFEKTYEQFTVTIGRPGQPLGYLFLDKMFQISTPVPLPSAETRSAYWKSLLRDKGESAADADEQRKKAEERALNEVRSAFTQEELQAKISEVSDDPVAEAAMRAAAAKQITSTQATEKAEHRLRAFGHLLEANPRAMKRLVNAYGLHQATHFLEGRDVSPDALAIWTIIELRWPLMSDLLAARPALITTIQDDDNSLSRANVPDDLKPLFADDELKRVVRFQHSSPDLPLSEEAILRIVG
jgi:hypothetical protein